MTSETVICVHGLLRSGRSFTPMVRALEREGFRANAWDYPSRRRPVEDHGRELAGVVRERCGPSDRVHFVTHSLGGIVVRAYFDAHRAADREHGRVVMIAPPNRGSEIASRFIDLTPFRVLVGPPGEVLADGDAVEGIGAPDVPVGVIAGARGHPSGYNPLLEGDDDAVVALASTHLEGQEDHLVVPFVHSFIMRRGPVIRQTIHFLRHGSFDRGRAGEGR